MNKNNFQNSSTTDPSKWVENHGDALFRYTLRFISDTTTTEDLVQEVLLAALKGRKSFEGASSERTWLIGILKNKIIDHYRKTNIENKSILFEQSLDIDDSDYITSGTDSGSWHPQRRPAHWAVDPNDPVEQQQFWEHLQKCLEGLDPKLSKVYNLREIQQIEYQEVCNVLAIKPTNLRVMLHRARKQLRKCLEINWISK